MPTRAVCDTNVVVSALLFESGSCAWLREAWRTGVLVPIVDRHTARELVRVLEYPKFRLSAVDRDELLAEYLPLTEVVSVADESRGAGAEAAPADAQHAPVCEPEGLRDPADQIFLDLALLGPANALITGDSDLLALADRLPFEILAPAQVRNRV